MTANVIRVIKNLLELDDQEEARKKAYRQGTVAIFTTIADLLEIDHTGIDKARQTAKRQLFDKLTDEASLNVPTLRKRTNTLSD